MSRYLASWIATTLLCCACGGSEFSAASSDAGSGGAHAAGSGGQGAAAGAGGNTVGAGGNTVGTGGNAVGTGGFGTGGGQSGEASTGCSTPTTWYPDEDHDNYGAPDGAVTACDPPASGTWVMDAGDCFDQSNLVYPGAADYHEDGYPTGNGSVSFDYDCSGQEDPALNQAGLAPDCTLLTACSGSGFVATGRTGSGVNSLCGSHTFSKCAANALLQCAAVLSTLPAGQGYLCR